MTNILSASEDERGDIAIFESEGASRPFAPCPLCERQVPGFELAKLDAASAAARGADFACGACRSQWEREAA